MNIMPNISFLTCTEVESGFALVTSPDVLVIIALQLIKLKLLLLFNVLETCCKIFSLVLQNNFITSSLFLQTFGEIGLML